MNIKLGNSDFEVGRIFCVGMNYSEHIRELNSKTPVKPVIFMKPPTSLVPLGHKIRYPSHGAELHFETELVYLIGKEGYVKNPGESRSFLRGVSLGFDLTLRDIQNDIKKNGLPWEICKAFDDSAPIGDFISVDPAMEIHSIEFTGRVNGEIRQKGNSSQMIFPIENLIHYIGSIWKLLPGDLVFTGTPPGVGPVKNTDVISAGSPLFDGKFSENFSWEFR